MADFLIKSGIAMAVLLVLYHLFLEREKMHGFNRFYLLGALVFSLALPFIIIPVYVETTHDIATTAETIKTVITPVALQVNEKIGSEITTAEPPINYWPYIITGIYTSITLILAVRFINNISHFIRKSAINTKVPYKGSTLILTQEKILPHTFLNRIFINEDDYRANAIEKDLYTHELIHVKQWHTLDILFIEVLKTIFWFNPLLYFYKKAIQLNHEFLADEGVIKNGDTPEYQRLLLQKTSYSTTLPLASNLNFLLTKKRFTMMTKKTSKWKSFTLKLSIVPVITAVIMLLCIETVAKVTPTIKLQETIAKDSLTEKDKKRDRYYAGVRIIIEDLRNNLTIDNDYEKLSLEQKREYLSYVPDPKEKKVPSKKEFEDYKNKSKFAIWLDDKNIDNAALNNYKNTDIAYIYGSSVYKNARTKKHPQPYQFHLFTNAYFDNNLKNDHLKYPEKIYKRTLWIEKKKPGKKEKITSYPVDYSDIKTKENPEKKQIRETPEFPGGDGAFIDFIRENLNPVYVGESENVNDLKPIYIFTVNENGSVSNIKTENDGPVDEIEKNFLLALEKEFRKTMELSPKWLPALKDGKPVAAERRFPLPYKNWPYRKKN